MGKGDHKVIGGVVYGSNNRPMASQKASCCTPLSFWLAMMPTIPLFLSLSIWVSILSYYPASNLVYLQSFNLLNWNSHKKLTFPLIHVAPLFPNPLSCLFSRVLQLCEQAASAPRPVTH